MITITKNEFLEIKKDLFLIGLMGGIASGKSTLGNIFKSFGAELIEADKIAHKILDYKRVKKNIVDLWGEDLLIEGKIDRKALSKIVFSDDKKSNDELSKLEDIIHPLLRRRIFQKMQNFSQKNKKIVVLDIALLWEGGLKEICDILVFIDTPLSIRQKRASENRNWEISEVLTRERFQENIKTKKKAAHFIIENKGDIEKTSKNAMKIWKKIVDIVF